MSTILERLLSWLAALGSTVVLLSATLPSGRRQALADAYLSGLEGSDGVVAQTEPYPRVLVQTRRHSIERSVGVSPRSRKNLQIRWIVDSDDRPHQLADALDSELAEDGCAAVICTTVRRAQQTFTHLKRSGLFANDELGLLHARFLQKNRQGLEKRFVDRFGTRGDKTKPRKRFVLVSTQIIEQSLDLDFDLMVSELAPVDLLLQRSGRLHRHVRARPAGLMSPQLWIIGPPENDGFPVFEKDVTYVYDEHVLLKTWLALREVVDIAIPDDVEHLIETVYSQNQLPEDIDDDRIVDAWTNTRNALVAKQGLHQQQAKQFLLLPPDYPTDSFLEQANQQLEEDDPTVHRDMQAMTRLASPSVTAICVNADTHYVGEGDTAITTSQAIDLMRHSVGLSHRGILNELISQDPPASWTRSPILRHCRLVELDEQNGAEIGSWRLEVNRELGVVIEKRA